MPSGPPDEPSGKVRSALITLLLLLIIIIKTLRLKNDYCCSTVQIKPNNVGKKNKRKGSISSILAVTY